jgi:RNA polymerase sigma-70 factor (ECF subfamily)
MTADPLGPDRKRLLGLAYRMLGSRADAEDVLQDAWLRFSAARDVRDRSALLTTIVSRLCLDRLRSSRTRREAYIGPWLPEPVADAEALMPDAATELADDISFALLLALERLSPLERAAFLLHDVFDVPFADVAATLERSEAACRQLASRARKAVHAERPAVRTDEQAHLRLLTAFGAAVTSGDTAALTALLREDAILLTDGGGKALAALNPILGADKIARFMIGVMRKAQTKAMNLRIERRSINGTYGIVAWSGKQIVQILSVVPDDETIAAVYIVRNPDKLAALQKCLAVPYGLGMWRTAAGGVTEGQVVPPSLNHGT